jgi:hypothetical protein
MRDGEEGSEMQEQPASEGGLYKGTRGRKDPDNVAN